MCIAFISLSLGAGGPERQKQTLHINYNPKNCESPALALGTRLTIAWVSDFLKSTFLRTHHARALRLLWTTPPRMQHVHIRQRASASGLSVFWELWFGCWGGGGKARGAWGFPGHSPHVVQGRLVGAGAAFLRGRKAPSPSLWPEGCLCR